MLMVCALLHHLLRCGMLHPSRGSVISESQQLFSETQLSSADLEDKHVHLLDV